MENLENNPTWQLAEKRVEFKRSLIFYFVINLFLIGVWYFSGGRKGDNFWPVWPILASGLGIVMQYIRAYHSSNESSVEKEYEKLKAQNKTNL